MAAYFIVCTVVSEVVRQPKPNGTDYSMANFVLYLRILELLVIFLLLDVVFKGKRIFQVSIGVIIFDTLSSIFIHV